MAIAALWVLPVSFLIVGCSGRVQKCLSKRQMKLKMDCADGIQECLETVRDLRANNAQAEYMEGLESKIRAVEKHALVTELGTAVFVAVPDDLKAWHRHRGIDRRCVVSKGRDRHPDLLRIPPVGIQNV